MSKDVVRGGGVIRLEVATEGEMSKTLNLQINLNRQSRIVQERCGMVGRGWTGKRSFEM